MTKTKSSFGFVGFAGALGFAPHVTPADEAISYEFAAKVGVSSPDAEALPLIVYGLPVRMMGIR
jgi:hypothetical protein